MRDSWVAPGVFMFVLLLVVTVLVIAAGRGGRGSRAMPPPEAVPADLQLRVRELLGRNKTIHAIKEVRHATGLGLAEAKGVVDALRSGPIPTTYDASGPRRNLAERARELRDGGDVNGAVTLVRAETGMSVGEAERFVSVLD